jgi:hypothetical protein
MVYGVALRRRGVLAQLRTVTVQHTEEHVGGVYAALPPSTTYRYTPPRAHGLICPCVFLHRPLDLTANKLSMIYLNDST